MRRLAASAVLAAAALAAPPAQAQDVCVRVTVVDFATGTHAVMPPCLPTPFSTFYERYGTGVGTLCEVYVEVTAPRLSSP